MADVKWIKIVTDIFDDEKIILIESMPEADAIIVIWFKLLCMAGKQNNSGVFLLNGRIAYTDEMLATIFRRPVNTVRLALKTFEEFGMIVIVNNTITIPNWEKHQQLDSLEKSREATRRRVASYRARQKQLVGGCNVTETVCNGDRIDKKENKNNINDQNLINFDQAFDQRSDQRFDQMFDDFWKAYPKKVSKQDALKAWKSLKPNKELLERILDDIQKRISYGGVWYEIDKKFIKHPAGYLRGRLWEDEPDKEPEIERDPDIEDVLRRNGYYSD